MVNANADTKAHHPQCPAIDGFGCHCDELYSRDTYWPFPTKDNPLKPLCPERTGTPKEVKAYAKLQREKAQKSPF